MDILKLGSKGESVAKYQTALNKLGASPPLKVDAIFGVKTRAATEAWQRAHGLQVNGTLDLATKNKMELELELGPGASDPHDPNATPAPEERSGWGRWLVGGGLLVGAGLLLRKVLN